MYGKERPKLPVDTANEHLFTSKKYLRRFLQPHHREYLLRLTVQSLNVFPTSLRS